MKKSIAINFLKKAVLIIAVCTPFLKPYHAISQIDTSAKLQLLAKKANGKFKSDKYNSALPLYLQLLKYDSTNFLYNYRAGECFLESNMETAKSVKYFEAARKYKAINDGITFDFYYLMGQAYHLTNRFDDAIASFTIAKTFPNSIDSIADQEIKQCELGKSLKQKKSDARVFPIGINVNSIYPDYSPLITPDQSALLFTSTRKGSTGGKTNIDGDFFADIFIAKNLNKMNGASTTTVAVTKQTPVFSNAENIGSNINTSANDESVALSPDGGVFYLYRKHKIYQSYLSNGKLTALKVFKTSFLNEYDFDVAPSMYFTNDGKELYFVSSRPGGYGGKDVYKSVLQTDGTWGTAQNLGAVINSNLNEETPFFDSDEQTLYFSSQGHNSIGGFDVYKSKLDNNTWGVPENLGFPINSGTNDIFYSYDKKSNLGFLTSMRKEGVGNYDVFMVKYLQPINVSLLATYSGGLAPKDLKVTVMNLENESSLKTLPVNQRNTLSYESNKEYVMLIPRYNSDTILDTLYFKTPETPDSYNSLQEIVYEPLKNKRGMLIGYKTTIYNAFFDIEKEIEKSGVRNQKALIKSFPMCREIVPALSYYKNDNLTKEEEYSGFVRYIKPDRKNFKVYTQTNYVDTSNFEMIYKMQDSLAAVAEMQSSEKAREEYLKKGEEEKLKKESEEKAAQEAKAKEIAKSEIFNPIHFQLSKSDFQSKYEAQLQDVADFMKSNLATHLELKGYTDSLGRKEFNKALSWDRAITIKRQLVKKGVAPERIIAEGFGQEIAPESGDGQSVEKNNRKVIFIIKNTKGATLKKK
jgi:outer membrane protein OmpA-like peptidoglycan-associated protein